MPDPWGTQIQGHRVGYGEARAARIPTHITLLPPTATTHRQVRGLLEHLTRVAAAHEAFEVVLRGTGTFRPVSQVVYVQVAQGVAGCEQLESAVRAGPVSRDLAWPYHPHVTLAHDVAPDVLDRAFAELARFECRYAADQLCVYVHDGDEAWRPIAAYPLARVPVRTW